MFIETIGNPADCDSLTVAVMTADGDVSTISEWEVEGGPQSAMLRLLVMAASNVNIHRTHVVVYYHNA